MRCVAVGREGRMSVWRCFGLGGRVSGVKMVMMGGVWERVAKEESSL